MITSLTKEQEARFPEFVDRWTKIGLCTDPADRPKAEAAIKAMYAVAGLSEPKISWAGSPIGNALALEAIKKLSDGDLASVRDSVRDSVRNSVWHSVGDSVSDSVRHSVSDSVWHSVWNSVRHSVSDSVWNSVSDSVRDSVSDSVWNSVWNSVFGSHDAGWLSFYSFFREVCDLQEPTEKLVPLMALSESCGWVLPLHNVAFASERYKTLKRNNAGKLHCDGGPAIEYPDGWSIYALNGILVSKAQAETPGEQMNPSDVLTETNVDIRRELIRKVGIERMLSVLQATVLDTVGNYQLLNVNLSEEIPNARFLKMLNPSIGVWHVEGVEPGCKSVQEAINWRAGQRNWSPEIIT